MTAPDGLASPDDFLGRGTTHWFLRIAPVSAGVIFAADPSGQKLLEPGRRQLGAKEDKKM
jgi:hypothetical protein